MYVIPSCKIIKNMKKSLLLLGAIFGMNMAFSQIIFSENFDGSSAMPAGWTLYNVDGLTPASGVSYVTDAWVVRANSATQQGNHIVSTSWYTPAGTSNDWIVSPSITIPATGTTVLEFDAMAPDGDYRDGFKVYISTTGNAVADFGTTPALSVSAAPVSYTTQTVDLSAYAGQTIHFAVRNDSSDKFLLFADNFVVRQVSPNDAKVNAVTLNRYSLMNTDNTLAVNVKNVGGNAITSVKINWNDGTDHEATINTNIAVGASANVSHPTKVNYATALTNTINVTITEVNATTDSDPSNNTGSTLITTISQKPAKNVVFEEGTGTWCGWCPRGAVAMDYMAATYPNGFIGIAVHNGDPMKVTEYDNGVAFSGFPSAHVDRTLKSIDVTKSNFESKYNSAKNAIVPASVGVAVSGTGATKQIEASATFYSNFPNANYRLGVIIVEDKVSGTTSGYAQTNYYAGGGSGPMGGYENLPDPVPASQMVYNHVGRALLGGFNGQQGSVPTSITDGQTVSYSFNYTIPSTSNEANMYAVAVLIDPATGEIINAKQSKLSSLNVTSIEKTINMNVYPNPATDKLTVAFDAEGGNYAIEITDLQGRVVATQTFTSLSGSQSIDLNVADLKTGNYLVSVAKEGASFTKMIAIK